MKTIITILASAFVIASPVIAAEKTKSYPKKTCIVTDSRLGSMGTPVTKVHEGQEVKFCCKPCVAKFEKDPKKYLGKL